MNDDRAQLAALGKHLSYIVLGPPEALPARDAAQELALTRREQRDAERALVGAYARAEALTRALEEAHALTEDVRGVVAASVAMDAARDDAGAFSRACARHEAATRALGDAARRWARGEGNDGA
jgi:hypothetical protein